jgi:hypothetical protein
MWMASLPINKCGIGIIVPTGREIYVKYTKWRRELKERCQVVDILTMECGFWQFAEFICTPFTKEYH